jgi:hypothetical protein
MKLLSGQAMPLEMIVDTTEGVQVSQLSLKQTNFKTLPKDGILT